MVDSNERCRTAGNENANLIYGTVGRVEGSVFREWARGEGEEQGGCHSLIYGVLRDVDEQKRKHAL